MHGKSAARKVCFRAYGVQRSAKEMKGLDEIVWMNVLRELKNLVLSGRESNKESKTSRHTDGSVRRVKERVNKDKGLLVSGGRIGFIKMSGKQVVTILP